MVGSASSSSRGLGCGGLVAGLAGEPRSNSAGVRRGHPAAAVLRCVAGKEAALPTSATVRGDTFLQAFHNVKCPLLFAELYLNCRSS